MHTEAYIQLLNQRNSDGYQRADGYDINLLNELSDEEIETIKSLLLSDLKSGDTRAIFPLSKIGDHTCINTIIDLSSQTTIPSQLNAEYNFLLFSLTNDKVYREKIINNLGVENENQRKNIIPLLLAIEEEHKIRNLLSDCSEYVRASAAEALLYLYGLTTTPNPVETPFDDIISKIASEDKSINAEGIQKLENTIFRHSRTRT